MRDITTDRSCHLQIQYKQHQISQARQQQGLVLPTEQQPAGGDSLPSPFIAPQIVRKHPLLYKTIPFLKAMSTSSG